MENEMQILEELLVSILVHLPVKSLLRFRCISKGWFSLITSPTFVNWHLQRDCKETMLLKRYVPLENSPDIREGGENVLSFHNPDSPDLLASPNLSIPFSDRMEIPDWICFLGPCNGLVCFIYFETIILFNPALREYKLLPQTLAFPEFYVLHQSGSGFGFDANSNSYKLIQIWFMVESSHTLLEVDDGRELDTYKRVEIYNSSTNSWRLIDEEVPGVGGNPGFELFFNGACHWQGDDHLKGIIVSFDIKTEVFQEFEFPFWIDGKRPSLVVLNQYLALMRIFDPSEKDGLEPYLIDIWVMKEYGVKESWTKEFVIGPYLFRKPLLCWKNKWLLVETDDSKLAFCALHTNEIKRYQFHGLIESFRSLIFKESLTSINQIFQENTR